MTTISAQNKYFTEESISFWDKLHCFNGIWEQVETGKYLPVAVVDGENLGTDGDQEEILKAQGKTKAYMIAGFPRATYIGCRETEKAVHLYWKDEDGNYYQDIVRVMEVERWFREIQKNEKEQKNSIQRQLDAGSEPIEKST